MAKRTTKNSTSPSDAPPKQSDQDATPAKSVDMSFQSVPTSLIQPGPNARVVTEAECADLAASIRQVGLLTPLVVAPVPGGGYRVIAGHRRLKALQMVGAESARIAVLADVDELTEAEVNAVENIVRTNLNPVEEAMAVARVVDGCGGDFAKAAAVFGRSESWVRDHGYIAKFEGKARDLVASGRLPLAHARMIAKVTDPAARSKLAEDAAGDGPNSPPMRLIQLEHRVGNLTRSLRLVPWEPDVAFGGFRACVGCPSNSDTDRYLFGAGESDSATCGNAKCFEGKQKASSRGIEKTATKLTVNGRDSDLSIWTVQAATPTGIKPTSVQRAAKKLIDGGAKKKQAAAASPTDDGKVDAWRLEQDWRDQVARPVETKLIDAIHARIEERPDLYLKLGIMALGRFYIPNGQETRLLRLLLDDRSPSDVLAEELSQGKRKEFIDAVVEVLGEFVPWDGPPKDMLAMFGIEPFESKKDYLARRTGEIKQAAAAKATARKRAPTKPAAKAPKARGKRGGKAAKR